MIAIRRLVRSIRVMNVILFAAILVLLFLWGRREHQIRQKEQTAIVAISVNKIGEVSYDYQQEYANNEPWITCTVRSNARPRAPALLRWIAGDNVFARLVVDCHYTHAEDEKWRYLAWMENVVKLNLYDSNISDNSLRYIETFRQIESLDLRDTHVTDSGLIHIAKLTSLRELCLGRCVSPELQIADGITDRGMICCENLVKLEKLTLTGISITDQGVPHIAALKKLRFLSLNGTAIGDVGLAQIATLPNLEKIDLCGTQISSKGLSYLKKLKHLTAISVGWTEITESDIKDMTSSNPHLFIGNLELTLPELDVNTEKWFGIEKTQKE